MNADVIEAISEQSKLGSIVQFVRHKQYQYALKAKENGFKFGDDSLEKCEVSASDILAIAGYSEDATARRIFEEYKANENKTENDLEDETST